MRPITMNLLLLLGISFAAPVTAVSQVPPDSASSDTTKKKAKKPPGLVGAITKRVMDTAATAAAGAGVQSLLGSKAAGIANALGAGGTDPCSPNPVPSSGAAIVGMAKGIVKKTRDSSVSVPPTPPCPQSAVVPGAAAGMAGLAAGAVPGMGGGVPGAASAPGGGVAAGLMAATPIGMAVTAAPLAAGAVKGLKGMLGGKPQDKIAMLRELGKGTLVLKDVKFIEGTAEMEPGFEPSFASLGEAVGLAEGTYILYVPPEAEKGAEPDTVLQRKRIQKVWAAVLVNGVSDQRIIAVAVLPKEMGEGRKPAKPGQARVEIIRMVDKP